jgi:adenosylcobyric acid synthase
MSSLLRSWNWITSARPSLEAVRMRCRSPEHGGSEPATELSEVIDGGLGYARGPVLDVYPHGMFEEPEVLRCLFGTTPTVGLEQTFDALADAVETHTDFRLIEELAG